MPIIDHFGLIAPFYDHAIPLRELEQYIRLIELPIAGVLLDVGGGTGRVAEALRDKVSQVVVVDASMDMLGQAQKKSGLRLTCSHSESLPFQTGAFDRVIMVDALHHVIDQQSSVSEIWRVVKPGGLAVVLEPDIRKLSVKAIAILEKVLLMRSHFLSPERIAKLFGFPDADLRIVEDGFSSWVCARKICY